VGLLLVPFLAGQIAQRWIGGWVARHRGMLKWFDQGSILLVVYSAFSEATVEGLYQQVSLATLGILLGISAVLLFVVMGLLVALFRYTDVGLRMRASAFNQEVARLLGVKVGAMLTLGWALASLVGSLAGLLIAGGSLVHPSYMDSVVVFGFVAAVLGGLDSPLGAVVGGLILGVSLSFVSGYVGSQLVALAALVILMLVLTLKPGGLFAQAQERRV